MAEEKEWIGKHFGKLLVVAEAEPRITSGGYRKRRFVCKCDCGGTVTVYANELSSGRRISCGCTRGEKVRIDLTGQRFGRLVVEKRVKLDKPRHNRIITGWLCKCDCGNETIQTTSDLRNFGVSSCGCAGAEAARIRLSTGDPINGLYDGTMIPAIRPGLPATKVSKTGVRGVCWDKSKNRYVARLTLRHKVINLGSFRSLEDARKARLKAEEEYFAPVIEAYEKEKKEKE